MKNKKIFNTFSCKGFCSSDVFGVNRLVFMAPPEDTNQEAQDGTQSLDELGLVEDEESGLAMPKDIATEKQAEEAAQELAASAKGLASKDTIRAGNALAKLQGLAESQDNPADFLKKIVASAEKNPNVAETLNTFVEQAAKSTERTQAFVEAVKIMAKDSPDMLLIAKDAEAMLATVDTSVDDKGETAELDARREVLASLIADLQRLQQEPEAKAAPAEQAAPTLAQGQDIRGEVILPPGTEKAQELLSGREKNLKSRIFLEGKGVAFDTLMAKLRIPTTASPDTVAANVTSLQEEFGFKGKDADGIIGKKTFAQLEKKYPVELAASKIDQSGVEAGRRVMEAEAGVARQSEQPPQATAYTKIGENYFAILSQSADGSQVTMQNIKGDNPISVPRTAIQGGIGDHKLAFTDGWRKAHMPGKIEGQILASSTLQPVEQKREETKVAPVVKPVDAKPAAQEAAAPGPRPRPTAQKAAEQTREGLSEAQQREITLTVNALKEAGFTNIVSKINSPDYRPFPVFRKVIFPKNEMAFL